MVYHFKEDEVKSQILDLMRENGIYPENRLDLQLDGKVHRFRVQGDSNGDKSGSYAVDVSGWPYGFVQDWRINQNHIDFSFKRERLDEEGHKYFDTDEKIKEAIRISIEHQKELRAKIAADKMRAVAVAADRYKQLPSADSSFPYLIKKGITLPTYDGEPMSGIKYDKSDNTLCIPLSDIDGNIKSLQWIDENGNKKFEYNTSPSGAFFSLDFSALDYDKEHSTPILIGEGVATMLTVYGASCNEFQPIAAAMNCGNLYHVAKAIKERYPKNPIIIMADNDHVRQDNPGLTHAQKANKELKLNGVIAPTFKFKEYGTDWNDFFKAHGMVMTKDAIRREIELCLMPPEKRKIMCQVKTINAQDLMRLEFAPMKWAVEGLIPTGLTLLAGSPKTGKSISCTNLALAIATGGYVFGKIKVDCGSVLYLALEDTYKRLQERNKSLGFETENLSKLDFMINAPRQDEGGLQVIRWWLEEHEDARLVIVDTLQKFRGRSSGKSSLYAEDYDTMTELKSLADEFDVAVIVVHHTRKMGSADFVEEVSGTLGLAGAADTIITLKRDRISPRGELNITGRDVEEKTYNMELDMFQWILLGEKEPEEKYNPEWLEQITSYLENVKDTVTATELSEHYNMPLSTAQGNIRRAHKRGVIEKLDYGKYSLVTNTE